MTPPNIGDEGEVLSPALKATPSSDALVSRLTNWKFGAALQHCEGQSDEARTLVQALADTFGDSGWFGGRMGAIVHAAMQAFEIEEVD
jgi:hypothetical protein